MSRRIWAPTYGPAVPAVWSVMTGDVNWVDCGATWFRCNGQEYTFIVFENCEDWGDGATGYHASVRSVDLGALSDDEIGKALACIGSDPADATDHEKAYAALTYGYADVCHQTTGTHPMHVRSAARRWAGDVS